VSIQFHLQIKFQILMHLNYGVTFDPMLISIH